VPEGACEACTRERAGVQVQAEAQAARAHILRQRLDAKRELGGVGLQAAREQRARAQVPFLFVCLFVLGVVVVVVVGCSFFGCVVGLVVRAGCGPRKVCWCAASAAASAATETKHARQT
jgi:hypothetical protein